MHLLKDLINKYPVVWIRCENEYIQRLFLLQAELEGFIALNGQKPTELSLQKLYGINDDMTMGYLSGMVWCLTMKNPDDAHVRIDFSKYVIGQDAMITVERLQTWKQLFYENGILKYEGMTIDNEPHGSGTIYYPNGQIYLEGVFGNGGLLCGTEYYPNGNIRFSGLYKYNDRNGPNYPQYGAFYKKEGCLCHEGEIRVRYSSLGCPTVVFPEDFGPVVLKGSPSWDFYEDILEIEHGDE